MLDDFLIRAGLGAVGVALAAGPLGCLIIWRRMAYYGDATAHAAILGVALSLAFSLSIFAGVLAVSLIVATTVASLSGRTFAGDTILGVIAHSSLAFGLVAVSFLSDQRLDLMSYLFGEILSVTRTDLLIIWLGGALVLALLSWRWSALLTTTTNSDLAYASGINPQREQLFLNIAIAVVIAVSIQVVGALLITAFLIIPAAAARKLATTPEAMALSATVIGAASGVIGLIASYHLDTPTGPTIVSVAALFFAVSALRR